MEYGVECSYASRFFGITILKPEAPGWFPAEELKVHYEIKDYQLTKLDRVLFGFREDGKEGICCPTTAPTIDVEQNPPKIIMEEDENEL